METLNEINGYLALLGLIVVFCYLAFVGVDKIIKWFKK